MAATTNLRNRQEFNHLLKDVFETHQYLQDAYEVAAILESLGWTDGRASREFGVRDVFELADALWEAAQQEIEYPAYSPSEEERGPMWIAMIRSFLRGVIFALPMAISIGAMLTLNFSLWSYQFLTLEQATGIAIGTILSFVLVGGFTQAIARRGYFYIIQGYYSLARKSTFIFICIGFVLCVFLALLIIIMNVIFNFFPYKMLFLIVLYFFFLTAIWLSVTVMYILKKEIIFTGLIIFGIFLVYVLFVLLELNIIISQLISLCIVSLCGLCLSFFFFRQERRKDELEVSKLPRFSITLYTVWPYFYYGFLYFSFLFVDRVNAWSKNEEYMPYFIWFRGEYELGLDFALLTIIIPMGVSEVVVNRLMFDVESSQRSYLAIEAHKMYEKYLKVYKRMTIFILISSLISSVVIYRLILIYNDISIRINHESLLDSKVTLFVLFWGMISYAVLAFCLMNIVILFAFSQPDRVLKAMVPSLLANILIGFLLSRWIDYQFAVFGLLVGSLMLFYLTTRSVMQVLQNLDYYLYAAS